MSPDQKALIGIAEDVHSARKLVLGAALISKDVDAEEAEATGLILQHVEKRLWSIIEALEAIAQEERAA